jgi:hypothetical protein
MEKTMKTLNDVLIIDEETPPDYRPLAELPLVIMVGLTGVGKTTTLKALANAGFEFNLLPNRRDVTDKTIIAYVQKEAGQAVAPVTDRLERFKYTARYREKFPSGMAHALTMLAVKTTDSITLVYDGLRGLDEVEHAANYFPTARFVVLDAPDIVRLSRLLTRGDSFDQVTLSGQNMEAGTSLRNAVPDIDLVFDEAELTQIAGLAHQIPLKEIVKKASIIVEERRNYDSQAARQHLIETVPDRVLVVDTAVDRPEIVAEKIVAWF